MNRDAFAEYHPLINFYFISGHSSVGCSFSTRRSSCALCFCGAALPDCEGACCLAFLSGLLPLFVFPYGSESVFNTYGDQVLFVWHIGNLIPERPYTMEALLYGMALEDVHLGAALVCIL